jgi:hypothetical protein
MQAVLHETVIAGLDAGVQPCGHHSRHSIVRGHSFAAFIREGLDAFQASIVAGSHPTWRAPICASGSGSLYLFSVSGLTPLRSATSGRLR